MSLLILISIFILSTFIDTVIPLYNLANETQILLANTRLSASELEIFKQQTDDANTVYEKSVWHNGVASTDDSGIDSNWERTESTRKAILFLLKNLNIRRFGDIPCGSFNWMSRFLTENKMHLPKTFQYVCYDVSTIQIERHKRDFPDHPEWSFYHASITLHPFPQNLDIILMRDVLFHLSYEYGLAALKRVNESGSRYFLSTTFPALSKNTNTNLLMKDRAYRPINLAIEPYNLGEPEHYFEEREASSSRVRNNWIRCLGLWKLPLIKK